MTATGRTIKAPKDGILALRGEYNPITRRYEQADGSPGLNATEIARHYGVSRTIVYRQIGGGPYIERRWDAALERVRTALNAVDAASDSLAAVADEATDLPDPPDGSASWAHIALSLRADLARLRKLVTPSS